MTAAEWFGIGFGTCFVLVVATNLCALAQFADMTGTSVPRPLRHIVQRNRALSVASLRFDALYHVYQMSDCLEPAEYEQLCDEIDHVAAILDALGSTEHRERWSKAK